MGEEMKTAEISGENASTTEFPDIMTEEEATTDEIAFTTPLPQDVDTEEVSTVSPEEEHLVTTKPLHVSTKKHGKKRKTSEEIKTTEISGENASTTEFPDIMTEAEAATDEIAVTTPLPQDVDTEEVST